VPIFGLNVAIITHLEFIPISTAEANGLMPSEMLKLKNTIPAHTVLLLILSAQSILFILLLSGSNQTSLIPKCYSRTGWVTWEQTCTPRLAFESNFSTTAVTGMVTFTSQLLQQNWMGSVPLYTLHIYFDGGRV
jgi:hypothetical protein